MCDLDSEDSADLEVFVLLLGDKYLNHGVVGDDHGWLGHCVLIDLQFVGVRHFALDDAVFKRLVRLIQEGNTFLGLDQT